jgi:DNA polymerase family B
MYSKYENIKAAELVTRYGCYTIKQCIKIAEDMFGWTVIYGDTDSIFVSSNVHLNQSITENNRKMQRLIDLCHNKPLYYSWHTPKHERQYNKTDGKCCIWQVLGPEYKDGKPMPMLPYQSTLFKVLLQLSCMVILIVYLLRAPQLTTWILYLWQKKNSKSTSHKIKHGKYFVFMKNKKQYFGREISINPVKTLILLNQSMPIRPRLFSHVTALQ